MNDLNTTWQTVMDIYFINPEAVNSDGVLINEAEEYYGKLNHHQVSTIKRFGRLARQKYPYFFMRDKNKSQKDIMHKHIMQEFVLNGVNK